MTERDLADLMETYSKHLQEIGSDLYRKAFENKGVADLTLVKFRYFELITRNPGITPGELARLFSVRKATVANALRDLETRGLVERKPSEEDGRVVRLFPTADAVEIYDYRRLMFRKIAGKVSEALGPVRVETMKEFMRIVVEYLEAHPGDPSRGDGEEES